MWSGGWVALKERSRFVTADDGVPGVRSVLEDAFLAHGRYDLDLLRELDFYLQAAGTLTELHDLVLARALQETRSDPNSAETRFWVALRGGLAERCRGSDL